MLYQLAASISIALSTAAVVAATVGVVQQFTDLRDWSTRPVASQPDRVSLAQELARAGSLTDAK